MLFKSRTVSVHGQRYLISYLNLFVASSLLLLERSFSQKSQSWIYCYQGTLSRRHKPTACTTSAHSLGFNTFTILQIHTITNRLEKKGMNGTSHSPPTHTQNLTKKKASKCQRLVIVNLYHYARQHTKCLSSHVSEIEKCKIKASLLWITNN